jgi:hypothetical protein
VILPKPAPITLTLDDPLDAEFDPPDLCRPGVSIDNRPVVDPDFPPSVTITIALILLDSTALHTIPELETQTVVAAPLRPILPLTLYPAPPKPLPVIVTLPPLATTFVPFTTEPVPASIETLLLIDPTRDPTVSVIRALPRIPDPELATAAVSEIHTVISAPLTCSRTDPQFTVVPNPSPRTEIVSPPPAPKFAAPDLDIVTLSYDTASDAVPTMVPHDIASLTLALVPADTPASTEESDTHSDACAPLPLDRIETLPTLIPRPDPLTLRMLPPCPLEFRPLYADMDGMSWLADLLTVPTRMPPVKARTELLDVPTEGVDATHVSDIHTVFDDTDMPSLLFTLCCHAPKPTPIAATTLGSTEARFDTDPPERDAVSNDAPSVRDPTWQPTVIASLRLDSTLADVFIFTVVSDVQSDDSAHDPPIRLVPLMIEGLSPEPLIPKCILRPKPLFPPAKLETVPESIDK